MSLRLIWRHLKSLHWWTWQLVSDATVVYVYLYAEQFSQHVELWQQLLDTGDARIVYVNDSDSFLGSGCDTETLSTSHTFSGKNWLGKSLMKLRKKLQVWFIIAALCQTVVYLRLLKKWCMSLQFMESLGPLRYYLSQHITCLWGEKWITRIR